MYSLWFCCFCYPSVWNAVFKGRVLVEKLFDGADAPKPLLELGEGSFFGEAALAGDTAHVRRNASIKALMMCHLYLLSAKDFEDIIEDFPEHANLFRVSLMCHVH